MGWGGDSPPLEGCPEGGAIPLPWRGAPKGWGGSPPFGLVLILHLGTYSTS